MQRGILLLAVFLLGAVSAYQSVSAIEKSGSYFSYSNLKGSWKFKADIAYETYYENGPVGDYWQKQAYGLRAWSNFTTTCSFEILQAYSYELKLTFALFDITPFKQMIQYVRPEFVFSGMTQWDAIFQGLYSFRVLFMESGIKENVKTGKFSFVDWFKDITNAYPYPTKGDNFVYNLKYQANYKSPDWKFSLLDLFVDAKKSPALKWYGKDKFWYKVGLIDNSQDASFLDYFPKPPAPVVPVPGPEDPFVNPEEFQQ